MRFQLIDKLLEASADRVVAAKNVSLAEEYLQDHFPSFPVLPGVLMLEAATQASAWAAYLRHGFTGDDAYDGPTVAMLKSARNVRYGHFVAPGKTLVVTAEATGDTYKVTGTVDDKTAFTGKISLSLLTPQDAEVNRQLVQTLRDRWQVLKPVDVAAAV
jgi:3-hydroxyacyl-[acyl-carrier-protein] dehydratase